MAPQKIYDSPHQQMTIKNWRKRGLLLKEGQTYKDIYSYVMSIERCERCGINFDDDIHNNKRCMDHNHMTGHFRQVLCQTCNRTIESKIPHLWISHNIIKKNSGKIQVYFQYQRKGFKKKTSKSLTKMIALSFINLLKESI